MFLALGDRYNVPSMTAPVLENLKGLQARIDAACRRSGRDPAGLCLVAVSKFVPPERIREAAAAGLSHFAESRQQEAGTKLPALKDLGTWHFIGHLQSNKARQVAGLFDVVQSVDSLALAQKLSRAAGELGRRLRIYAQVNISGEPQKHGFRPEETAQACAALRALTGLELEGLMGMAAAFPDPEGARPQFRALKALAAGQGLKCSMGMSQDFEVAVEEGSDMLRLGTALFQ